jgi:hypothetical protein
MSGGDPPLSYAFGTHIYFDLVNLEFTRFFRNGDAGIPLDAELERHEFVVFKR